MEINSSINSIRDLEGEELEKFGRQIFLQMGLKCFGTLNQVRLLDIDPTGSHGESDHTEVDYLIPYNNFCLVGEITARENITNLRKKYRKFMSTLNLINNIGNVNDDVWRLFGIENNDLRSFRNVNQFFGFFISSRLEVFDVQLDDVNNIACFFQPEWERLIDYANIIGTYSKHSFLNSFNISSTDPEEEITVSAENDNLIVLANKNIISGLSQQATVFTFSYDPYKMLPLAHVYRKDHLPLIVDGDGSNNYQRMLISSKIKKIREILISDPDFMFPNNILIVLTGGSSYDNTSKTLRIPKKYGEISIIDGQHRLFSYADNAIKDGSSGETKVFITAIKFDTASSVDIEKFSARAFIEINFNQTKIARTHIKSISYDILGETTPEDLAATVVFGLNKDSGKIFYGIFKTPETRIGVYKPTTIITYLKPFVNIDKLRKMDLAASGTKLSRLKMGYDVLLSDFYSTELIEFSDLVDPYHLIKGSKYLLNRYFRLISSVFFNDWPTRKGPNTSLLQYSKAFAAFLKLLNKFLEENHDWDSVKTTLEKIRKNVLSLRRAHTYDKMLFEPSLVSMPDPSHSVHQMYLFFNANRTSPK